MFVSLGDTSLYSVLPSTLRMPVLCRTSLASKLLFLDDVQHWCSFSLIKQVLHHFSGSESPCLTLAYDAVIYYRELGKVTLFACRHNVELFLKKRVSCLSFRSWIRALLSVTQYVWSYSHRFRGEALSFCLSSSSYRDQSVFSPQGNTHTHNTNSTVLGNNCVNLSHVFCQLW